MEPMTRGALDEAGEREVCPTHMLFCSWPFGQLACVFGNVYSIYLLDSHFLAVRVF